MTEPPPFERNEPAGNSPPPLSLGAQNTGGPPSLPNGQEPEASPSQVEKSKQPQTFGELIKTVLDWISKNIEQSIQSAIIGAIFGFVFNLFMMAFVYDGVNKTGRDGFVTGTNSLLSGSLFCFIASSLVFAVWHYCKKVGTDQLIKQISELPETLSKLVRHDGALARAHMLWGAGISLIGTLIISPALSGALSIVLVASVPTFIGRIITGFFFRVWSFLVGLFKPGSKIQHPGQVGLLVAVIGSAAALAVSFLVRDQIAKIVIAAACIFFAFSSARGGTPPGLGTILIFTGIGALYYQFKTLLPAFADDGGTWENGGVIPWLMNGGIWTIIPWSLLGGLTSGLGGPFGAGLGDLLANSTYDPFGWGEGEGTGTGTGTADRGSSGRDTDGDGVPDLPQDSDGDGVPDFPPDMDGDGVPDYPQDSDGDGVPDYPQDLDGDGVPDYPQDGGQPEGPRTETNPDGSTTTYYPDGTYTTTRQNSDGSVTVENSDGTYSTTQQNSDGSVTTTNSDGSSVTHFQDGSYSTQNADGTTSTTSQDESGRWVTHHGDGSTSVVNPDGSRVTQHPNGRTVTENTDGSTTTTYANGSSVTTTADGRTITTNHDGTQTVENPNGTSTDTSADGSSSTTTYPNGSRVTHNADGTRTFTYPDGTTLTEGADGRTVITKPDGSTTTKITDGKPTRIRNADGSITVQNPDGSTSFENPDGTSITNGSDGSVTTTAADGSSVKNGANGSVTSTASDGSSVTDHRDGSRTVTNTDGSSTTDHADGSRTWTNADGSSETHHSNGSKTWTNADGSSETRSPDGTKSWKNADGSTETRYPDGSKEWTNTDGSSEGHYADGSSVVRNADGSSVTKGADGTVTEAAADGSSVTRSPDGTRTVQNTDGSSSTDFPDGSRFTQNADGTTLTENSDGSSFATNQDGSTTSTSPEGTKVTEHQDGTKVTTFDNGRSIIESPNGQTVFEYPDGTRVVNNTDGSTATINTDGSYVQRGADGSSFTRYADGSDVSSIETTRDGSTITNYANGRSVTENADGSSVYRYPDGTAVVNNSDGSTVTYNTNEDGKVSNVVSRGLDGSVTTQYDNGRSVTENSDGSSVYRYPDGTAVVNNTDGSTVTYNTDDKGKLTSIQTHDTDGSTTTQYPDRTVIENKDGPKVTKFPDTTAIIENPDGSKVRINPDGSMVTQDTKGNVTHTPGPTQAPAALAEHEKDAVAGRTGHEADPRSGAQRNPDGSVKVEGVGTIPPAQGTDKLGFDPQAGPAAPLTPDEIQQRKDVLEDLRGRVGSISNDNARNRMQDILDRHAKVDGDGIPQGDLAKIERAVAAAENVPSGGWVDWGKETVREQLDRSAGVAKDILWNVPKEIATGAYNAGGWVKDKAFDGMLAGADAVSDLGGKAIDTLKDPGALIDSVSSKATFVKDEAVRIASEFKEDPSKFVGDVTDKISKGANQAWESGWDKVVQGYDLGAHAANKAYDFGGKVITEGGELIQAGWDKANQGASKAFDFGYKMYENPDAARADIKNAANSAYDALSRAYNSSDADKWKAVEGVIGHLPGGEFVNQAMNRDPDKEAVLPALGKGLLGGAATVGTFTSAPFAAVWAGGKVAEVTGKENLATAFHVAEGALIAKDVYHGGKALNDLYQSGYFGEKAAQLGQRLGLGGAAGDLASQAGHIPPAHLPPGHAPSGHVPDAPIPGGHAPQGHAPQGHVPEPTLPREPIQGPHSQGPREAIPREPISPHDPVAPQPREPFGQPPRESMPREPIQGPHSQGPREAIPREPIAPHDPVAPQAREPLGQPPRESIPREPIGPGSNQLHEPGGPGPRQAAPHEPTPTAPRESAPGPRQAAPHEPTPTAPRESAPGPRQAAPHEPTPTAPRESAPGPRQAAPHEPTPTAPRESAPGPRQAAPHEPTPRESAPGPRQAAPHEPTPTAPREPAPGPRQPAPHEPTPTAPREPAPGARQPAPHEPTPTAPREPAPGPRQPAPHEPTPTAPHEPTPTAPREPAPGSRQPAPHEPTPTAPREPAPGPRQPAPHEPTPTAPREPAPGPRQPAPHEPTPTAPHEPAPGPRQPAPHEPTPTAPHEPTPTAPREPAPGSRQPAPHEPTPTAPREPAPGPRQPAPHEPTPTAPREPAPGPRQPAPHEPTPTAPHEPTPTAPREPAPGPRQPAPHEPTPTAPHEPTPTAPREPAPGPRQPAPHEPTPTAPHEPTPTAPREPAPGPRQPAPHEPTPTAPHEPTPTAPRDPAPGPRQPAPHEPTPTAPREPAPGPRQPAPHEPTPTAPREPAPGPRQPAPHEPTPTAPHEPAPGPRQPAPHEPTPNAPHEPAAAGQSAENIGSSAGQSGRPHGPQHPLSPNAPHEIPERGSGRRTMDKFSEIESEALNQLHRDGLNSPIGHVANDIGKQIDDAASKWAKDSVQNIDQAMISAEKASNIAKTNNVAEMQKALRDVNLNPPHYNGNLDKLHEGKQAIEKLIRGHEDALKKLPAGHPNRAIIEDQLRKFKNLESNIKGPLDDALSKRAKDIENELNKFARENGMPEVKVKHGDIAGNGSYRDGVITLNEKRLLDPNTIKQLKGTSVHEFTHLEQDALIIKNAARELEASLGRKVSGQEVVDALRQKGVGNYSKDFVDQARIGSQNMTPRDILRAKELETAFLNNTPISKDLKKLGEFEAALNKDIANLNKQLNNMPATHPNRAGIEAQIASKQKDIGRIHDKMDDLYYNRYMGKHEWDAMYTGDRAARGVENPLAASEAAAPKMVQPHGTAPHGQNVPPSAQSTGQPGRGSAKPDIEDISSVPSSSSGSAGPAAHGSTVGRTGPHAPGQPDIHGLGGPHEPVPDMGIHRRDMSNYAELDRKMLRELHEKGLNSPIGHVAKDLANDIDSTAGHWGGTRPTGFDEGLASADKARQLAGKVSPRQINEIINQQASNAPRQFGGELDDLYNGKKAVDKLLKSHEETLEILKGNPNDPTIKIYENQIKDLKKIQADIDKPLREALDHRAQLVENKLNEFARQNGLPEVKVKASAMDAGGGYSNGHIKINEKSLLSANPMAELKNAAVHEFTHLEQDALIVKNVRAEMQAHLGHPPTPDELAAELQKRMPGRTYSSDFVDKVAKSATDPLTPQDIYRARQLEEGFRNAKSIQDEIDQLQGRIASMNKDIERATQRLSEPGISPNEASKLQAEIARNQNDIGRIKDKIDDTYYNNYMKIHEKDAMYVGDRAARGVDNPLAAAEARAATAKEPGFTLKENQVPEPFRAPGEDPASWYKKPAPEAPSAHGAPDPNAPGPHGAPDPNAPGPHGADPNAPGTRKPGDSDMEDLFTHDSRISKERPPVHTDSPAVEPEVAPGGAGGQRPPERPPSEVPDAPPPPPEPPSGSGGPKPPPPGGHEPPGSGGQAAGGKPDQYRQVYPTDAEADKLLAGMPEQNMKHAQVVADKYVVEIQVRPTNPYAKEMLETGQGLPKPEFIKTKTINADDVKLGAPEHGLGKSGYFEPRMPEGVGPGHPEYERLRERLLERQAEYRNAASDIENLQRPNPMDMGHGERPIELRDGVIYDKQTGKPFVGDHDMFDIRDGLTGKEVSPYVREQIVKELKGKPFEAQHGDHMSWNPQGPVNEGISEAVINKHRPPSDQLSRQPGPGESLIKDGKEPLITFKPNEATGSVPVDEKVTFNQFTGERPYRPTPEEQIANNLNKTRSERWDEVNQRWDNVETNPDSVPYTTSGDAPVPPRPGATPVPPGGTTGGAPHTPGGSPTPHGSGTHATETGASGGHGTEPGGSAHGPNEPPHSGGESAPIEPPRVPEPPPTYYDPVSGEWLTEQQMVRRMNMTPQEVANLSADDLAEHNLMRMQEREIANPLERHLSTKEKVDELVRLSHENKPLVEQLGKDIDARYGAETQHGYKNPQDIELKAKRPEILAKKPWFDVEHIRDSFRFRTIVEDLKDMHKIVNDLKSSGFELIKRDPEKLLQPKALGWRVAPFDLRAPNGQLVEYYIVPREMYEAGASGQHELFKKWRETNTALLSAEDKIAKQQAIKAARDMADDSWNRYLQRTGQTEDDIQRFVDEVHKQFQ